MRGEEEEKKTVGMGEKEGENGGWLKWARLICIGGLFSYGVNFRMIMCWRFPFLVLLCSSRSRFRPFSSLSLFAPLLPSSAFPTTNQCGRGKSRQQCKIITRLSLKAVESNDWMEWGVSLYFLFSPHFFLLSW